MATKQNKIPMFLSSIPSHLILFFKYLKHYYLDHSPNTYTWNSNYNNNYPTLDPCATIRDKSTSNTMADLSTKTLVCHLEKGLLRSPSYFPYFMLVAFEGGGLVRALMLLLFSPLVGVVNGEWGLRVMVFISFVGLKKDVKYNLGVSCLAKFFLEDVGLEGFRVLMGAKEKVVASFMPRVMVEMFLKEYLKVDGVVGTELHVVNGYYTGLMKLSGGGVERTVRNDLKGYLGEKRADVALVLVGAKGFCPWLSLCKQAYVIESSGKPVPKNEYPKPLIFHDSRLTFRPTPLATLAMFTWLPFSLFLAITRLLGSRVFLPPPLVLPFTAFLGVHSRGLFEDPPSILSPTMKGTIYACNHRTLLDPLYIANQAFDRYLTCFVYSASRISRMLSPIPAISLTRQKDEDRKRMKEGLRRGDVIVCPEGTTCREPYLLRFSPLFAETTNEIVPVALNTTFCMFYPNTAGGRKYLDFVFYLIDPFPCYYVHFLRRLKVEETCMGGKTGIEVANIVQRRMGEVLGFECTSLTRRDKYNLLAGNDGMVSNMARC